MSLLLNASQAIDGAGEIRITTWTDVESIFVRIQDSGKGIPPEKLEGLFEIGFTSRSSKVRLGTGLFNAYNIIQKHRGDITAHSEPGQGATFTIRLPIGAPGKLRKGEDVDEAPMVQGEVAERSGRP